MPRTYRHFQTQEPGDRPPAGWSPGRISQHLIDAVKFHIVLDECSGVVGRLDPDGTAAITASNGRGQSTTAWTTDPRPLRDLIARLTDLAACLEANL